MKKLFFLFFLLTFFSTSYGGWFICYSYKGMIGKDSVVFYMQLMYRYSDMKNKDLPVYAVYMNTKINEPVSLEGVLAISDGHIRLIHRDRKGKQTEKIDFTFLSPDQLNGKWSSLSENKTVNLVNRESMIDTAYMGSVRPTTVLMDTALPNAYIEAVYSRDSSANYNRASIKKLKIINKATHQLVQEIDLSKLENDCGNTKTILFKNVELEDYNKDGYPDLLIWVDVGKMGSVMYAVYDPKKKKFVLRQKIEAY